MSAPGSKPVKSAENWAAPLETLAGRRLALVVSGGVAAYKAAELARLLVRSGAQVRAVLTANAARFVTPLTFESLTGQPACLDMWVRPQYDIEHIALADWAEALIAAPATANFLAKMAHGLADDFASTFLLAFGGPVLAAPAMNSRMLAAQATKANLESLAGRGVELIASRTGLLACGTVGDGRLADPETIALAAARALGPGDFSGRRLVVSAGSTREPWDDIRFMANRSSGRMGLDLALAAWLRGAEVQVAAGPAVAAPPPLPGLTFQTAESTRDMLELISALDYDTLIMAAAPADFRPAERVVGKIKKGASMPRLALAANPDILNSLPRAGGRLYVGFAAEEADLVERARGKLRDKDLDLVAANRVGGPDGAFASAENRLWLVYRDGRTEEIGPRPKFAAAWSLLTAVKSLAPKGA
ncbi:MAG: bifunctional phosphopantothenoylcysteine decarboxylase/phosphopantothenate--cysteine ligase CoaBC [Candidatus Adiutrix sp.]|jgi:phosphopantothenoylcysteine decarboxylase/phosphopantothenate--cysteine ligase|nr:bifunctional phosphopantothenoylcysteine decarboxylase/phosphopantothenate--cysteine ligase CoaBC [Candidatus Adiutrix sp.]